MSDAVRNPARYDGETIAAGHAAFRDLIEDDIEAIVRYWCDGWNRRSGRVQPPARDTGEYP